MISKLDPCNYFQERVRVAAVLSLKYLAFFGRKHDVIGL